MEFVEVDRGFPETCWYLRSRSGGAPVTKRSQNWQRWLTEQVGERGPGQIFQHLCERRGERINLCCNPAHVTIGDRSTNSQHMHDLRRAAGEPWAGAPKVGVKRGPYKKGV